MPRIVALDVGDATIGVAASDELNITANPVTTIRRSNSVKADLRAVEELLRELDACKVVVGNPLDLAGEEGIQALKVKEFAGRLTKRLRIPVVMWDESLSTAEAESTLIEMDISRGKRRKIIDQMAAAVILQSYLESTTPDTRHETQDA
ncbi:MAG: Holliday junction resolvase RuvX [Armatimonadota bacterium]|nr:Holliday junction resolvase RuvX [bacterium]